MTTKKSKIIRGIQEDSSILTGKRKNLFDRMRKLYPKGNESAQTIMCVELSEERVDYYLNNVFNSKK